MEKQITTPHTILEEAINFAVTKGVFTLQDVVTINGALEEVKRAFQPVKTAVTNSTEQ